jgi:DNA topoisomerase VI subunit A
MDATAEVDELACPNLKWIGVHFEDFKRYDISSSLLLELSKTDEKKISNMMQREVKSKSNIQGESHF